MRWVQRRTDRQTERDRERERERERCLISARRCRSTAPRGFSPPAPACENNVCVRCGVLLSRKAVHDELLQRGRRGHQLDGLLIFDKDQRQRFLQLSSTTTADQTKEKHEEEYDPAKDCLHVKCKVCLVERFLRAMPHHSCKYTCMHGYMCTCMYTTYIHTCIRKPRTDSAILRVRRAAATHR